MMRSAAAEPTKKFSILPDVPPENAVIVAAPLCVLAMNLTRTWPFCVRASLGSMRPSVAVNDTSVPFCTGVPAPGALRKLGEMFSFCQDPACRHRALARYFGQEHGASCGACDVCLGEVASADGSGVIADNILKGVDELGGRFGATHVADVLTGGASERIRVLKHDKLASYDGVRQYLLGEGLVASTGELWRKQRKLMAPFYTPKGVQAYAELMVRDGTRLVERWQDLASKGTHID